MKKSLFTLALSLGLVSLISAQYISEFEPNPAGGDPDDTTIEIGGGTPSAAFDLWVLSIENDGFNGLVDRFSNVTGSYDANGMAVVMVPDLENPSFTLVLTDSFTGDNDTDIDPADDGVLVTTSMGTILDAIGVSDAESDDVSMYGVLLGGSNVLYNGQFEPLLVFRDSGDMTLYNTVTVNFGDPDEYVGVFTADGTEVQASSFDIDPTTGPTYGSTNPAMAATWMGYAIMDGWVDTGDWLGKVYVADAPWIYVYDTMSWMLAPDEGMLDMGNWVYLPM
ncbi:MAG: hypothetical protein AB3N63_04645 [Puniceicoccaceae bacterium]